MKQEIVINHILRDLKMMGLIDEEYSGEVRPFLNAVYVAGFEEGRSIFGESKERAIEQYNTWGRKIKDFDSILKAARKVKCSDRLISRALKSGKKTRAGNFWRYKESADVNQTPALNPKTNY